MRFLCKKIFFEFFIQKLVQYTSTRKLITKLDCLGKINLAAGKGNLLAVVNWKYTPPREKLRPTPPKPVKTWKNSIICSWTFINSNSKILINSRKYISFQMKLHYSHGKKSFKKLMNTYLMKKKVSTEKVALLIVWNKKFLSVTVRRFLFSAKEKGAPYSTRNNNNNNGVS